MGRRGDAKADHVHVFLSRATRKVFVDGRQWGECTTLVAAFRHTITKEQIPSRGQINPTFVVYAVYGNSSHFSVGKPILYTDCPEG